MCCVLNFLLIVIHSTDALQEIVIVLLPESKCFGQSIVLQLSYDRILLTILVTVIKFENPVAIKIKVNILSLLWCLAYIEVEDDVLVACQGCDVSVMGLFTVFETGHIELRLI